jgi:vancomycin resistance protein YoaR
VGAGKEAATSYGVKDFKFVNELSIPVIIESQMNDGKITVRINAA